MKKAGGIKLKASPPVVRSYRKWPIAGDSAGEAPKATG